MSEVHEPVALLNEQLGPVIDDVLRRLTPDRPMWRLGWGVIDTDDLYQAVDGTAAPRPVDAPAAPTAENRTRDTASIPTNELRAVHDSNPSTASLDLVDIDQMSAVALADSIESMPIPIAEYKQLDRSGNDIADWLRSSA